MNDPNVIVYSHVIIQLCLLRKMENCPTRFSFTGFPTLYFIDSEGKVQMYEGPREKDALKKFLEDNKTPVEGGSDGEGVRCSVQRKPQLGGDG